MIKKQQKNLLVAVITIVFLLVGCALEDNNQQITISTNTDTRKTNQVITSWKVTVTPSTIDYYGIECTTAGKTFELNFKDLDTGTPYLEERDPHMPCTPLTEDYRGLHLECSQPNESFLFTWIDYFYIDILVDGSSTLKWVLDGENYDFWCQYTMTIDKVVTVYKIK